MHASEKNPEKSAATPFMTRTSCLQHLLIPQRIVWPLVVVVIAAMVDVEVIAAAEWCR